MTEAQVWCLIACAAVGAVYQAGRFVLDVMRYRRGGR